MIVHVLHEGATLCGFGYGQFPGEWPGGHRWTYAFDHGNVTCEKCRRKLEESQGEIKGEGEGDEI